MNIDIIGTVYTEGKKDKYGEWITKPEPVPGYHVNVNKVPKELKEYEVFPRTPRRVFAGAETHCLKFDTKAIFEKQMAEWLDDSQ